MSASNEQIVEFITLLGNLAVEECNRREAAGSGWVVPSICIAQSAHETGWGQSDIMTKANAFFGIKAGGSWSGKVFTADTREVINGESVNITANFRAYDKLEDSVRDYYDLITNARYAAALSRVGAVKTASDTINAIHAGGYATEPLYVDYIMDIVNGRDLTQWDSKVDGVPKGSTEGGSGSGSGGTSGEYYYDYIAPINPGPIVSCKFVNIKDDLILK